VDFDGDGHLDLVSGSYDPGELYLFRGQGQGEFAARETINDKSGKPILKVPDQKNPVESFGSWMTLVDWDADGDLDILVGTYDGFMFLRRNEGTRKAPSYATTNEWLHVGDKRLRIPGEADDPTGGSGHANPVIADWDGDGLWDIVTGSANGGVYWYRNAGRPGEPQLAAPVTLVPAHEGIGYSELLDAERGPKPGIRSQIAVTDYNGDGQLDLLLGDFCTYLHIKNDLSAAERQEFKKVQARQDEAVRGLRASIDALRKQFAEELKGVPRSEWNTPANSEKWQKMYQAMRDSSDYKALNEKYEQAEQALIKFVDRPDKNRGGGPDVPHGHVWLFRRR
jgi:hypothetical protein